MKTKRILSFAGMTIALFAVQSLVSHAGSIIADGFSYERIDPYRLFAPVSVHHVIQLIAALVLILILARLTKRDFGLHAGDHKSGLRSFLRFTAIFSGYTAVSYAILFFLGALPVHHFPLNAQNVTGTLLFQLLLSGPSEELMFRALPITMLVFAYGKSVDIRLGKFYISVQNVVTALLFSLAHVRWSLSPFEINADIFQLAYAFVLGAISGYVYQKSKSVLYPMMMHSFSNVLMVGTGYILASI